MLLLKIWANSFLTKTYNITGEVDSLKVTKDSKFYHRLGFKVLSNLVFQFAELKELHLLTN
jgi:hypothetical protein